MTSDPLRHAHLSTLAGRLLGSAYYDHGIGGTWKLCSTCGSSGSQRHCTLTSPPVQRNRECSAKTSSSPGCSSPSCFDPPSQSPTSPQKMVTSYNGPTPPTSTRCCRSPRSGNVHRSGSTVRCTSPAPGLTESPRAWRIGSSGVRCASNSASGCHRQWISTYPPVCAKSELPANTRLSPPLRMPRYSDSRKPSGCRFADHEMDASYRVSSPPAEIVQALPGPGAKLHGFVPRRRGGVRQGSPSPGAVDCAAAPLVSAALELLAVDVPAVGLRGFENFHAAHTPTAIAIRAMTAPTKSVRDQTSAHQSAMHKAYPRPTDNPIRKQATGERHP